MRPITAICIALLFCSFVFAEDKKNSWSSPGIPSSPSEFWKVPSGKPPELKGSTPTPAPPEIQNKLDWTLADLIDKTGEEA